MHMIHRLTERLLALGAGLSMALVFGIIFINSLRRYTTGQSFEWGEELPVYLTVYGVMFGIALACLQDRHIRFTVVTDLISDNARRHLFAAMDAVTCIVGLGLVWSGWAFASRRPQVESSGLIGTAKDLAESTGAEWIVWLGRVGTWQSAIAIGGGFLALAAALRLYTRLTED